MKFKYHQDNGHGWLEVPIELLKELGIETKITNFSYIDRKKGVAYLEEDMDASTFCNEYLAPDKKLITESIMSEKSFIRKLPQYKPELIITAKQEHHRKEVQISLF